MARRPLLVLLAALLMSPVAMADRRHHEEYRGYYGHERGHRPAYREVKVYRPRYREVEVYRPRYREVRVYEPRPVRYVYAREHYHRRGGHYERHYHDHCDEDYYLWVGGAMVLGGLLHHAIAHH